MIRDSLQAPSTGLLLTGGGARAAYQVGVLEAIADLRKNGGAGDAGSPFDIITGTSAGAINAAALACGADDFDLAVRRVAHVWRHFQTHQVYQSDALSVMRTGARWLGLLSLGWLISRSQRLRPRSLLDNTPLEELLQTMVPLERLPDLIAQGRLQALAVTASSYSTGEHVTFFEGSPHLQAWIRSHRMSVRDRITHQHLLASAAIPFVFPAVALPIQGAQEYFGDGSMRQTAPVAPAIHLGAQRILVIGASRMREPKGQASAHAGTGYPSLAQIAGHAMSSIFLDALAVDIERMQRINQTISLVPPEARQASSLRPIDLLVIAPSQRLDTMAARHIKALPAPVRVMLGGVGVSSKARNGQGGALTSYLLFESAFTGELMQLGYADAMRQQAEIHRFFDWPAPRSAALAPEHRFQEKRRDPLRLRY
jgi:NTE family protein